jgi:hypothetical protein
MTDEFPDEVMRDTAQWVEWFSASWRKETPPHPMKIHSAALAEDGTHEWHPDFAKWLTDDERKARTRKVMRRLRRTSVREYEVCYRVCVLGERLDQTAEWLSERASRNDIPLPPYRPEGPHYTRKDAMALLIAGLAFAKQYW